MNRRGLLVTLRVVATLAMLGLLAWRSDLGRIPECLAAADPVLIAAAAMLILLRNGTQAWRWRTVLAAWQRPVAVGELLRLVFIGNFFTLLLPTSAGGDLARWSLLSRPGWSRTLAAQSVLADRLVGLAALGALSLLALPWTWSLLPSVWLRAGLLVIFPATLLGLLAVLEPRWVPVRWRRRWPLASVRRHRAIAGALAIGLLNHLVAVGSVATLGLAVGDTTSFGVYATLLPVVWLLSMLPIAIGGLGVREAGFLALFTSVGMDPGAATTVAGLWLVLTLVQAGLGGLLLLVGRRRRSVDAAGDGHQGTAPAVVPAASGQAELQSGDGVAEAVELLR